MDSLIMMRAVAANWEFWIEYYKTVVQKPDTEQNEIRLSSRKKGLQ